MCLQNNNLDHIIFITSRSICSAISNRFSELNVSILI